MSGIEISVSVKMTPVGYWQVSVIFSATYSFFICPAVPLTRAVHYGGVFGTLSNI